MRPLVHTKGPLTAASANNIATAQTPTAAAGFTINGALASGGVATLDVARRVMITTTADESAKTVLVSGTDSQGRSISETLAAPNISTAYTTLDFETVTSVVPSANFAANATLGTTVVASSLAIPLDHYGWPIDSIQTKVTGVVTYSLQYTLDDPFSVSASTVLNWVDFPDPNFVGATAGFTGGLQFLPAAVRILITDGSGGGSVTLTILQPGILG